MGLREASNPVRKLARRSPATSSASACAYYSYRSIIAGTSPRRETSQFSSSRALFVCSTTTPHYPAQEVFKIDWDEVGFGFNKSVIAARRTTAISRRQQVLTIKQDYARRWAAFRRAPAEFRGNWA